MSDITYYLTDTNVYRYYSNDSAQLKSPVRSYWSKALKEVASREATILTCAEVVQELTVQMHTLKPDDRTDISRLLSYVTVDHFELPIHIEYELRDFSNYIRATYGAVLRNATGYKAEYLKTSDARILVAAYMNDAVLVTANIKDFLNYLLFVNPAEDKLYDVLQNKYVKISLAEREPIAQDARFQAINEIMQNLTRK